jgi:hypothetical protein
MVVSLPARRFEPCHIDHGDPYIHCLAAGKGYIRTSTGTKSDARTDRAHCRSYCLNRLRGLSVSVYGTPCNIYV